MSPEPVAEPLADFQRLSALPRMYEVAHLLRQRPHTVRELAQALYPGAPLVDRAWARVQRSLQRDLERLEGMGVPIERRGGRPPVYEILLAAPPLSPMEALAVHAALRLMSHHSPAHNEHYLGALRKLSRQLPEAVQRQLDDIPPGPVRPRENENLEKVARAWFGGRALRFEYGRTRREREPGCELEVYYVEVNRQNLATYVIGREVGRGAVRTFKLSRMWFVTLLERHYEIPADFSPASVLSGAWGVVGAQAQAVEVTLRFAEDAAYRVLEGGYPGMGEPEIQIGGALQVRVRAGVDKTGLPRELLPWILGWGPRVEVLAPENVRQHWLSELEAALRNATRRDGAEMERSA